MGVIRAIPARDRHHYKWWIGSNAKGLNGAFVSVRTHGQIGKDRESQFLARSGGGIRVKEGICQGIVALLQSLVVLCHHIGNRTGW